MIGASGAGRFLPLEVDRPSPRGLHISKSDSSKERPCAASWSGQALLSKVDLPTNSTAARQAPYIFVAIIARVSSLDRQGRFRKAAALQRSCRQSMPNYRPWQGPA